MNKKSFLEVSKVIEEIINKNLERIENDLKEINDI